jgi:hypothetical protein
MATSTQRELTVARVFMGISEKHTVIGYSQSATLASLSCALSSRTLGLNSAIGLQGYTLGGISFGEPFQKVSPKAIGNLDALIASALIVESRQAKAK